MPIGIQDASKLAAEYASKLVRAARPIEEAAAADVARPTEKAVAPKLALDSADIASRSIKLFDLQIGHKNPVYPSALHYSAEYMRGADRKTLDAAVNTAPDGRITDFFSLKVGTTSPDRQKFTDEPGQWEVISHQDFFGSPAKQNRVAQILGELIPSASGNDKAALQRFADYAASHPSGPASYDKVTTDPQAMVKQAGGVLKDLFRAVTGN